MSLEQLMGRRRAPELGGYTTPLTTDVSDLPERLGKAIAGAQQSILLERGIEQQTSQDFPEEAVSPEYQEHIIDFSQLYTPQPRVAPVPQEQPIEATPVPKQPVAVVAPAPVITSPLQQLSQQLKGKTPELSGYSSTTPTTRADGWNGMRNGVPIGRDNPFAPITETPAPVVVEAPADVQPVEQTAPPSIDEQLANLNAQANGDGTYGSFLPSNPELKSQERGTNYERISTDDAWNDKDFRGFMRGQGVSKGSALQYQEPGTPYPSADGSFGEAVVGAKDGFYQPAPRDELFRFDDAEGRRRYSIGQAVTGHPDFGSYKAYWDGDKFVSLTEFYRRWQMGDFDFKTEKFGTGFMRSLKEAWEAIPSQVTDYVSKGLENNARQNDLTAEMLSNLPGAPKEVTDFMSRFLDAPDKADEMISEISRNTQFDRDFLALAIFSLMSLVPGGSKKLNKISNNFARRLKFEAKNYGNKPLNINHTGKPKGLYNPKFPRDTMKPRKPKATAPAPQETSRVPEVGIGNQNRRLAERLKLQTPSNAPTTSPTASAPTVKRNTNLDDLVDSQSAKLKGEFDRFSQQLNAKAAARAAEFPAHIRKAFLEIYGFQIPKGYKMSAKMRQQLENISR